MHRSALGAGALSDEWAHARLPEHVGRKGFVFVVAREQGQIVGFAYGYEGAYGHWWTDHVATSLSESQPAASAFGTDHTIAERWPPSSSVMGRIAKGPPG